MNFRKRWLFSLDTREKKTPEVPQFQIKIVVPGNWWMIFFFLNESSVVATESDFPMR